MISSRDIVSRTEFEAGVLALCRQRSLSPVLQIRLAQLGSGLSNAEITAASSVSINTVKSELKTLFRQLGIEGRSEVRAAFRASRHGRDRDEVRRLLAERFPGTAGRRRQGVP